MQSLFMSIVLLSFIGLVLSIKLASYNTYQLFTHTNRGYLLEPQIAAVLESGIDVFCFQELNLASDVDSYGAEIESVYPNVEQHQFTRLNVLESDAFTTPRVPCDQQQIDILTSQCALICSEFFDGGLGFAYCLATVCPDLHDNIAYTECAGCVGLFAGFQPNTPFNLTLDGAVQFCQLPHEFLFDVHDGLLIATKEDFPITNTWTFDLPSWLFLPRRVNIAQIDVCSETNPGDDDCTDSIIFGCTHMGMFYI